MNNINWKIRLQSKEFWIAMLSQIFVVITVALNIFDVQVDLLDLQNKLTQLIVAVFQLIAVVYTIPDTTTPGFGDSEKALSRENLGD